MDFPTIFYRSPGPHSTDGKTWDYIGVQDSAQAVELLEKGWAPTLAEALEGPKLVADLPTPPDPPAAAPKPKSKR